jgi:hypothetical protein
MRTLELDLHLSRLPDYEPGYVHLGYTLGAAFTWDAADDPPTDYLAVEPWSYEDFGGWLVVARDPDGTLREIKSLADDFRPLTVGLPASAAEIRQALAELVVRFTGSGASFDPAVLGRGPATLGGANRPSWRAALGELATQPAPLPQVLGLAGCLRLTAAEWAAAGAADVLVAPRILFGVGREAVPTSPAQLEPQADTNTVWRWPYLTSIAVGFTVVARQQPLSTAEPPVDLTVSLPLEPQDDGSAHLPTLTVDVTRDIEDRLAELFDVSLHLADLLETPELADVIASEADWTQGLDRLRDAFLVCLRDRANDGDAVGPSGLSLVAAILQGLPLDARAELERLRGLDPDPADDLLSWLLARLARRRRRLAHGEGGTKPQLMLRDRWLAPLLDRLAKGGSNRPPFAEPALPPWPGAADEAAGPEAKHQALCRFGQELRALRSALYTERVVRESLVLGWEAALDPGDSHPPAPLDGRLEAALRAELAMFPLERTLAHGNLGAAFRSIAERGNHQVIAMRQFRESDGGDPTDLTLLFGLRDCLDQRMVATADERWPEEEYAGYQPLWRSLPDAWWRLVVDHYAPRRAVAFHQDLLARREGPTATSEGLVIQVQAPRFAFARHEVREEGLNGYGLLLRDRDLGGAWLAPNLVGVVADGAPVTTSTVAPLKLQLRSLLHQALLTYDDRPMAASAPALFANHEVRPVRTLTGAELPIEHPSPYGSGGEKLVALVFAHRYQVAVHGIALCGALPPWLAAVDPVSSQVVPWQLASPLPAPPHSDEVTYWRTVQVGTVRVAGDQPGAPSLQAPPARLPRPRGITPLALALWPHQASEHGEPETLAILVPPSETLRGRPLWRGDAQSTMTFAVQPPRVDIWTWHRWVRGNPALATTADVVDVFADAFSLLDTTTDAETAAASRAASPDDPAVTKLRLEVLDKRLGTSLAGLDIDLPPHTAGASGLARYQRPAVGLRVTVAAPTAATTAPTAKVSLSPQGVIAISLAVPPAVARQAGNPGREDLASPRAVAFFELRISPVITTADQDRFLPAMRRELETALPILVEVPAPPPADPDRLHKALLAPSGDRRVDFALDPSALTPAFREAIHRCELALQNWRWDGRSVEHREGTGWVDGFRFPATPDQDPALVEDDAILFGDRSSLDHLTVPGAVDLVNAGTAVRLHQLDLSSRPGAQYLRCGVIAFSRYESILDPVAAAIDSRRDATGERWRRHVTACRYRGEVPAPRVKIVVPLTRSHSADVRSPGLLVVLEESFYEPELGGLAERIEAEILQVTPGHAPDEAPPPSLPELGPDATLDLDVFQGPLPDLRLHGPVGYTFDTDTLAPLFRRAAVVLELASTRSLAFYFAKVRFRRSLRPVADAARRDSPWTAPIWVQLLPPVDAWQMSAAGGNEWRAISQLAWHPGTGFHARDPELDGLEPLASVPTAGGSRLQLWRLITHRIVDLFGRADQEAYRAFEPAGAPATVAVAGDTLRLVEVQATPGTRLPDSDSLFEALFPSAARTAALGRSPEATARIVRVSDPMPVI